MKVVSRLAMLVVLGSCVSSSPPFDLLEKGIDGDIRAIDGSKWSIDDGVLIPDRGEARTYIVTSGQYSDIEITLEFYPDAGTNSGVFVRCQDPATIDPLQCYEINIWDAHPDQQSRTGAIVTISPPLATVQTEDRWNTIRVRVDGPRLRAWVNDTLTNDVENDRLAVGYIALQYGGENGMVRFRNIRVKKLD